MTASIRVAFVAVVALAAAACGGESTEQVVAGPGALGHIHDMVLDADDVLFVASHSGLYRIDGIDRAVLVNPEQHDLMAMTSLDNGDLIVGGHPDLRLEKYVVEDRPPFLGLTSSSDGGQTWVVLDLLGEADFHALAPTNDGLFAAYSSGLIAFRDAAGTWTELGEVDARDLAVNPGDVDLLVATDHDGSVWASSDGAATWERTPDAPALLEVEWISQSSLIGIEESGRVWSATTPFGSWSEAAAGPVDAETLLVDPSGSWWVSVHGGAIFRSDDEGATWTDVYIPPEPL